VQGAVDPLLKAAARFNVTDITSHEPNLEEIFLAFYGHDDRAA
jgi:ABC-2 type transport system ATP-binding protein